MKKEQRIVAILKNKIKETTIKNRVKAFKNAIETARLNAELDLTNAEDECTEAIKALANTEVRPSEIVNKVFDFIKRRNEINESLNLLKEVEKYISEEVEIDE